MTKEIGCKSAVYNDYMGDYATKLQSNLVSHAIIQYKNTAFRRRFCERQFFMKGGEVTAGEPRSFDKNGRGGEE